MKELSPKDNEKTCYSLSPFYSSIYYVQCNKTCVCEKISILIQFVCMQALISLLNYKNGLISFWFFLLGSKNSLDCTLILTEGDSAKTLAVSGLGVVGRDKYGVFPLRGKMLNVREASHKQVSWKIIIVYMSKTRCESC